MTYRPLPNGPQNLVLPSSVETVCPKKSNQHKIQSSKAQKKGATQLPYDKELKEELVMIVPNSLPNKTDEDWMRKLWDKIQKASVDKKKTKERLH